MLKISHKISMNSYIYQNEDELLRAQKVMINLGQHCLTFGDYVDFEIREYYY